MENIKETLIQTVYLLNRTASMENMGHDPKWCRGMYNYHIAQAERQVVTDYEREYVIREIKPETRKALLDHFQYMADLGKWGDNEFISLLSTGLLISEDH